MVAWAPLDSSNPWKPQTTVGHKPRTVITLNFLGLSQITQMERNILLHTRPFSISVLHQHTGKFVLITLTLKMKRLWLNETKHIPEFTQSGCLERHSNESVLASTDYVLSTLPCVSELSETFLGLVLRNLNKFLSGILCESKNSAFKIKQTSPRKGKGGGVKFPSCILD